MPKKLEYRAYLSTFKEGTKAKIIKALNDGPLTTTATAVKAEITWKTAQRNLFELVDEGKVELREIEGGTKLFTLNPDFRKGGGLP